MLISSIDPWFLKPDKSEISVALPENVKMTPHRLVASGMEDLLIAGGLPV